MQEEKIVHQPPAFEEETLWNKIKSVTKKVGKEVLVLILTLFYCLKDKDTPAWAKSVIIGALIYFISPIDAIPDFLPGGYVDDIAVLLGASSTVVVHIKPEHRERANEWVDSLFGSKDDSQSTD